MTTVTADDRNARPAGDAPPGGTTAEPGSVPSSPTPSGGGRPRATAGRHRPEPSSRPGEDDRPCGRIVPTRDALVLAVRVRF